MLGKYRNLTLHSPGSDSTVYTSYTTADLPYSQMYYPPQAGFYSGGNFPHRPPHRYSHSHISQNMHQIHQKQLAHLSRFNGLNYLSSNQMSTLTHGGPSTMSYADWSREHWLPYTASGICRASICWCWTQEDGQHQRP